MSKTYKGHELIKAIVDGEIKEGQQFNVYENGKLYFDTPVYYKNEVLKHNGTLLTEFLTLRNILNLDFELIEDEKIDIQKVASIKYNFDKETYIVKDINEAFKTFVKLLGMQSNKINELVQAVNQISKYTKYRC